MNERDWKRCVEFHGHACVGLAIGFRAAQVALARLGVRHATDEELVCVTESDACGVDAVQVLTGCSTGKGNLVYRGTGKEAFSFFDRKNQTKVRVLFKKMFSQEDDFEAMMDFVLRAPAEELFRVGEPSFQAPETAQIFLNVVCEACGEIAPENKIRLRDGKKLCIDCLPEYSRGW